MIHKHASWIAPFGYSYLVVLFGWFALSRLAGDSWWWLFLLNSLALYLFLPLPPLLVLALARRKPVLAVGSSLGLALWLALYGPLFIGAPAQADTSEPAITVMTYNTLLSNRRPETVLASIRAADADVIALQELNPIMARALHDELAEAYPYQVLDPQIGTSGLGVISRYPIRLLAEPLPGDWTGRPQVFRLDIHGRPVTLLNVHLHSTMLLSADQVLPSADRLRRAIREREREAQTIADFAAAQPGPLIVTGDFNTTDQSMAYRIVAGALHDSWREAGWGLGHTYGPGLLRLGFRLWLVRIDYIFVSDEWHVTDAHTGLWGGISDHRPLIATLRLQSEPAATDDTAPAASAPATPTDTEPARPLALYTFQEGSGSTIFDEAGRGQPLNLSISDAAAVRWLDDGLLIGAPVTLASEGPATKIINAAQASNELTIEAWIAPQNTSQDGPARIVTLSRNGWHRNVTLGQGLWENWPSAVYDVRLRTTDTSSNGQPSLLTVPGSVVPELAHIVYTRQASGLTTIYLNSVAQTSAVITGDLSGWDGAYRLALANELTGGRPWLGTLYRVAIYDRALNAAEIAAHFQAGPQSSAAAP